MPLYFAYGSNMDEAAMRARCPRSRAIGLARLPRHAFALMADGYATIARHPQDEVHGVLYDLALSDIPALDRYEAVAQGLYAKITQAALPANGAARRALVYVGAGGPSATPRVVAGYMEGIVAAARAAGLPAGYLKRLESLGPRAYVEPARPRAIKWTPRSGASSGEQA